MVSEGHWENGSLFFLTPLIWFKVGPDYYASLPGMGMDETGAHYTEWSKPERLSSVQFSCSVMSNSLRPPEPQHARPPCPSPTPGVHPNSWPLNRWCHPTISSSVVPFSSLLNLSQHQGLFRWDGSSHQVAKVLRVSASTSVLPINT